MHLRKRTKQGPAPGPKGKRALRVIDNLEKLEDKNKVRSSKKKPRVSRGPPSVALFQQDILEVIFGLLDIPSLRDCRLVTKAWNDEASRQLSKRAHVKFDYVVSPSLRALAEFKEKACIGDEKLANLYSAWKHTETPILFTNLTVNFKSLETNKLQALVKKFGTGETGIKSLEIQESDGGQGIREDYDHHSRVDQYYQMKLLHDVLTKWCPNLSKLHLYLGLQVERVLNYRNNWKFEKSLKLTEIHLRGLFTRQRSEYFIKIVQMCTQLKKLHLTTFPTKTLGFYEYDDDDEYPPEEKDGWEMFFSQLSTLKNITRNLEEFRWSWDHVLKSELEELDFPKLNVIKLVYDIEFGKNLKVFQFGPSADFTDPKKRFLPKMLQKLANTNVDTLAFDGIYAVPKPPAPRANLIPGLIEVDNNINIANDDSDDEGADEISLPLETLPVMPKIKSVTNSSRNYYGLRSLTMLSKFPNLESFEIWKDQKLSENNDNAFEIMSLPMAPGHSNLKRMLFKPNFDQAQMISIPPIVSSFPQLESFSSKVITNYFGRGARANQSRTLIEEVFIDVLPLNQLRKLDLTFDCDCIADDLCKAFKVVKDFPKLERLTIKLEGECNPTLTYRNMRDGILRLREAPCLQNVHLIIQRSDLCTPIPDNVKKSLLNLAKRNGIPLEITIDQQMMYPFKMELLRVIEDGNIHFANLDDSDSDGELEDIPF